MSKVHGKLSCLMINDIDAGIGHFENTQVRARGETGMGLTAAVWQHMLLELAAGQAGSLAYLAAPGSTPIPSR